MAPDLPLFLFGLVLLTLFASAGTVGLPAPGISGGAVGSDWWSTGWDLERDPAAPFAAIAAFGFVVAALSARQRYGWLAVAAFLGLAVAVPTSLPVSGMVALGGAFLVTRMGHGAARASDQPDRHA